MDNDQENDDAYQKRKKIIILATTAVAIAVEDITSSWPSEISHFMLECLVEHHRSERNGDNGLRKEEWQAISIAIKDRFQMTYEWEQCRNHYRVWKTRLKALSDLQKNSGLGWNAMQMRFDAPQHVWSKFKRKEQKFWKKHRVLPIHIKVGILLGYEIATGTDVIHPSEAATTDAHYHSCHPVTGASSREKRRKGVNAKNSSALRAIATAITQLVMNDSFEELARRLSVALDTIPGIDFDKSLRAKEFFLENRNLAIIFLQAKDEQKPMVLDYYLPNN